MNKKVLAILIFLFILAFMPHTNASNGTEIELYNLELILYRNGSAELENIHYGKGYTSHFTDFSTGYNIREYDSKGNVLFDDNFYVSFGITGVPMKQSLENITKNLRIPHYSRATRIDILHDDEVILRIDLRDTLCNGDGVCEEGENKYNCPEDCERKTTTTRTTSESEEKCGNGVCEEGENQSSCPEDCGSTFPYYILWIVIAIVVVVISIMIIVESRKSVEG